MKYLVFIFTFLVFLQKLDAQTVDSLKGERFTVHFQTTVINQFKLAFTAKYSGTNSLITNEESKTSITSTLFLGTKLWKGASLFINPEIAGGAGLSEALGIADAPNGETFRVGDPSPKIYLGRLFLKQIIPLARECCFQESNINQLARRMPLKYIAITVGKIGLADYFDDNKFSHDPRTQFFSWGLMSNGAWDYPANTRGYTPSVVVEYISPSQELRYAYSLVPVVANGNMMEWNFLKAGGHSLEYVHRHKLGKQEGAIRFLAFLNTANMGNYQQSIDENPINPSITNTRENGRTKYGFGINAEQNITSDFGAFMRASWNDGHNETWMFTEIDRSLSLGFSITGKRWKRANDNMGLAFVCSGISSQHQEYLKAGGTGFMLGDGNLNYHPEHLMEWYYNSEIVKDLIYLSGAYQLILNPGYNFDRKGPVSVFSIRVHAKI